MVIKHKWYYFFPSWYPATLKQCHKIKREKHRKKRKITNTLWLIVLFCFLSRVLILLSFLLLTWPINLFIAFVSLQTDIFANKLWQGNNKTSFGWHWGPMNPTMAIWAYPENFLTEPRTLRLSYKDFGQFWIILDHLGPFGIIWDPLGPFGNI